MVIGAWAWALGFSEGFDIIETPSGLQGYVVRLTTHNTHWKASATSAAQVATKYA